MKEYVNLLFSIIDKIDSWELKTNDQKINIIKFYRDDIVNYQNIVNYYEKYREYLIKNTFNNLTKDILSF